MGAHRAHGELGGAQVAVLGGGFAAGYVLGCGCGADDVLGRACGADSSHGETNGGMARMATITFHPSAIHMVVDPGDWLPLIGLGMIGACTALGVAGAFAIGRARGMRDAFRENSEMQQTRERVERMERSLEAVAEEIERLGEVQRFALKLIGDRVAEVDQSPPQAQLPTGRVITPH